MKYELRMLEKSAVLCMASPTDVWNVLIYHRIHLHDRIAKYKK